MNQKLLASMELLSLIGYETVLAWLMGAFRPMQQKRKSGYLLLAFLPLAIMVMFHGENVGYDTPIYLQLFDSIKKMSLEEILQNGRFETGYLLLNYFLTRIFSDGQSVMIVEGAIVCLSCARWINKWSRAPGLLICLMVETLWFDHWMSLLRQSLAVAILLFSYDAIVEKKPLRFLVEVILAAQFHAVAYAFLVAYPTVWWFRTERKESHKKSWKFEYLMLSGAIGVTILFQPALRLVLRIFPKYQYYLDGAYIDGKPRLAVFLNIMVYSVMLLVPRLVKNRRPEPEKDAHARTLYRMSLINSVLFVAANQATVMTRIAYSFSIFAMMDSAEQVAQLKNGKNREILTVVMLILFALYGVIATVYRTPAWQKTYPFEWCFR